MHWRTNRNPDSSPPTPTPPPTPAPTPAPRGLRSGLAGTKRFGIVAGLVAVLVLSVVGAAFAGVFSSSSPAGSASGPLGSGQTASPARSTPAGSGARTGLTAGTGLKAGRASKAGRGSRGGTAAAAGARPAGLRTSCTSVAHIGDSTSVGMVSPQWLPDPAQRLAAQYRDVGVRHAWINASGGRSIVEEMPDQANGYTIATKWDHQGFHGCWVFALGTNDTANVSVGSNFGLTARIDEMMSAAHGQPVMWVNTQTDLSSGPWSEANMQRWNHALLQAARHYPNMRIFNWSAMVKPSWHLSDGIHYTSAGYAIRARAIAHALARAFPADGHSTSALIG
jgi:hypothetical protein